MCKMKRNWEQNTSIENQSTPNSQTHTHTHSRNLFVFYFIRSRRRRLFSSFPSQLKHNYFYFYFRFVLLAWDLFFFRLSIFLTVSLFLPLYCIFSTLKFVWVLRSVRNNFNVRLCLGESLARPPSLIKSLHILCECVAAAAARRW